MNPSGCSDEDDDEEDDDDGGDKDDDDGDDDDDDDDEENDDNEDDDDRSSMNYSILRISSTSPDAPTDPRFLIHPLVFLYFQLTFKHPYAVAGLSIQGTGCAYSTDAFCT